LCGCFILQEELQDLGKSKGKKKRLWVRDWIAMRDSLSAPAILLTELASEDRQAFRNHLRVTAEKFEELLGMVEPLIRKKATKIRASIPSKTKLKVTLLFLAIGDSFKTLEYLLSGSRMQHF
jgi:hypothetical protein